MGILSRLRVPPLIFLNPTVLDSAFHLSHLYTDFIPIVLPTN